MIAGGSKQVFEFFILAENAGLALELTEYVYVLEVGKVVLEGKIDGIKENENVRRAFLR